MNDKGTTSATPTPDAADPIFFTFLQVGHTLMARLESALQGVGLSPAKFEVLDQLVRAGEPVPLRVLAEGQRCVPSNMTQLIDRLEADGLVRRVDDPSDRRIVRAGLTALGIERARTGADVVVQVQEEFAASLAPADRAVLGRVLAALR